MSNQKNDYFRCGGCQNIVPYSKMQEHYESNHTEGLADTTPRPAVENPPAPPMFHGHPVPPSRPEPKMESSVFNIVLMYRNYPRAFKLWTLLVFALTALFISSVMIDLIVYHI